jgi:hypothetical protein
MGEITKQAGQKPIKNFFDPEDYSRDEKLQQQGGQA